MLQATAREAHGQYIVRGISVSRPGPCCLGPPLHGNRNEMAESELLESRQCIRSHYGLREPLMAVFRKAPAPIERKAVSQSCAPERCTCLRR